MRRTTAAPDELPTVSPWMGDSRDGEMNAGWHGRGPTATRDHVLCLARRTPPPMGRERLPPEIAPEAQRLAVALWVEPVETANELADGGSPLVQS